MTQLTLLRTGALPGTAVPVLAAFGQVDPGTGTEPPASPAGPGRRPRR
jgi:hypothetical protein